MALSLSLWLWLLLHSLPCLASDPTVFNELRVSYIIASPLGFPQHVIAINDEFPGLPLNVTTGNVVVVNVKNELDEDLLITWPGVQMRQNAWQDGVLGTNCPIPPKLNWTYEFEVKGQIGSFFYFPSLNFQKASGGFGPFVINNGEVMPIPFARPDGDIVLTIGDWYTQNQVALRTVLDNGQDLGLPDGVTGVAILHYSNSKGPATGSLPDPPNDAYYKEESMNQARSVRQNTSASGARPNPQGSYHYGSINITDTYLLKVLPPVTINGKVRAAINGISFVKPEVPFRLADQKNLTGVYKLDFPSKPSNGPPLMDRSLINATYKGFIEIVLQNNDITMQSFHLDGYSAFVVGIAYGNWLEDSRNQYKKWDAIPRSSIQVYAGGWTAILVSLDTVGLWNLRAENLDRWYLGQETYLRIVNPKENGDIEMAAPDNVLYYGPLKHLQNFGNPTNHVERRTRSRFTISSTSL